MSHLWDKHTVSVNIKAQLHGSESSSNVYYVISPRVRMSEFNFGETIARNGFVLVVRVVC